VKDFFGDSFEKGNECGHSGANHLAMSNSLPSSPTRVAANAPEKMLVQSMTRLSMPPAQVAGNIAPTNPARTITQDIVDRNSDAERLASAVWRRSTGLRVLDSSGESSADKVPAEFLTFAGGVEDRSDTPFFARQASLGQQISAQHRAVTFDYVVNHRVREYVTIQVCGLITSGPAPEPSSGPYTSKYVSLRFYADSLPVSHIGTCTRPVTYCPLQVNSGTTLQNKDVAAAGQWKWCEWCTLPIKYNELTMTATVAATVHNMDGTVFGGTTMQLFGSTGLLREGIQKLTVHLGAIGDGNVQTSTPGGCDIVRSYNHAMVKSLEAYRRGKVTKLRWLDAVTLPVVENLCAENDCGKSIKPVEALLFVGLPFFQAPLVYEPMKYHSEDSSSSASAAFKRTSAMIAANTVASPRPNRSPEWKDSVGAIIDPELFRSHPNPTETKHHRLARGVLRGMFDVDPKLQPNRQDKERIKRILDSTSTVVSQSDREVLWKFRYTLTEEKRSLTKFLLSVDWNDEIEVRLAAELMPQWKRVDIADALTLLSKYFAKNAIVRKYALGVLDDAHNDEIEMFMLQLVQAMRYEVTPPRVSRELEADISTIKHKIKPKYLSGDVMDDEPEEQLERRRQEERKAREKESIEDSLLSVFLVDRALESFPLATSLYWHLSVEQAGNLKFKQIFKYYLRRMEVTAWGRHVLAVLGRQRWWMEYIGHAKARATEKGGARDTMLMKLKDSLRSDGEFSDMLQMDPPVVSALDSRVALVGVKPDSTLMFKSKIYPVVFNFDVEPRAEIVQPDDSIEGGGKYTVAELKSIAFVEGLQRRAKRAELFNSNTNTKPTLSSRRVQARRLSGGMLGACPLEGSFDSEDEDGEGSSNAHDRHDTSSSGDDSAGDNSCRRFGNILGRSSPSLSSSDFHTSMSGGGSVPRFASFFSARTTQRIMYKAEDLRQDQLVVQMITLIDRLWKSVNLDLKLTPYRVLATTPDDGLVEFINDTTTLTDVYNAHNRDIRAFFKHHNPPSTDPIAESYGGVDPEVMETFIRSSAGYCVITYILGIGDRHLENLMLKPTGHLLHIDFGFLFGKDPKPLPAPMRLTKEMMQAMGGRGSPGFDRFKRYCCQGYNVLRRRAPLLLSLLELLRDAGINDFSVTQNPDTVMDVMKEKLRLDLGTDEAGAEQFLLGKLEASVSALFPELMDIVHSVAVNMR
jgi:hypothetical protein